MVFNRDKSWLQFNDRVLEQAIDKRIPLLERIKFLQIFTTNLDEFFMKRVGALKRQLSFGLSTSDSDGIEINQLLTEIRKIILYQLKKQADCWKKDLVPQLRREGIFLLDWNELRLKEMEFVKSYFETNLFPVLTPLSVGPGHPFPFLSNLSYSLGVLLRDPTLAEGLELGQNDPLFARVKIPNTFPQWIRVNSVSDGNSCQNVRLISLIQVISHFIGHLFPGMEILDLFSFRVTRNASIERDEEDAEDLLEMVAEELRQRRFSEVVRLEHGPFQNSLLKDLLKNELELAESDSYLNELGIDFSQLSPIIELKRPNLKYRPWTPVVPYAFQEDDRAIFGAIRASDILVQHPYESFTHTVEKFVETAVDDPSVLAIKMTLYRTGLDSPFVPLLIRAAEAGKQVVCLVELKARFDEEKNIRLARSLEDAGVHVVYGIIGLKTHCKLTLIVRQEEDRVRSYAHIGTGNYHAGTARLYTDFGFFTANPDITADVIQLFHFLTGRSLNREYKKLLVAPIQMKSRFLELIEFETEQARRGRSSRIISKMNSLEDMDIIQALYTASQAGVKIDLIVRGFCCLVPQRYGLSENIRVISVIGRFLEHCRIFYFQHGSDSPLGGLYFLGSADWMSRNLTKRVEAITPIEDRSLKARLFEFLHVLLNDHRSAWELTSRGTYEQRDSSGDSIQKGTQEYQMALFESVRQLPMQTYSVSH